MRAAVSPPGKAWPVVQLSEVAEQCLGKMLDAQKNRGKLLPYLRNPNVRWFEVDLSDLKLMPFEDHELERFGLRKGDVVICEGGEAGRAAIWDGRREDVKFQKAIHRVRTGPKLDARFLVHRLKADYFSGRLAEYYTGTTIKHLTGQDLARYQFALPPLPEQRRIAEILDKADALRAKRRAAIEKLSRLREALFLESFGDPSAASPKYRTASLGTLCRRITDGTHQPPKWTSAGCPFLFVSNIVSGEIDLKTSKFIAESTYLELTRRCPIEVGDVLYSTVGTYGIPAVVRTRRRFAFQRHIAHIKPDPAVLDSEFLGAMLGSEPLRRQAERAARGVAQKTVNLSEIRDFLVLAPPLEAQRDFARKVASIMRLRDAYTASGDQLQELIASLQERAFRGDL
ncbi:MAG: restriction endonuclease subunit S [Thermoanaerobaculia bacterium]|nr:restriction endonuclease subunit S [Thermoanaerobaculia bacterium]